MKRLACHSVVFCLGLFLATAAQAQNYVYKFYDGQDGTGNVMATYTGPLITKDLTNTATNGVLLNSANLGNLSGLSASALQPCTLLVGTLTATAFPVAGDYGYIQCVTATPQNQTIELFTVFPSLTLPQTPGVYNVAPMPSPFFTAGGFIFFLTYSVPSIESMSISLAVPTYSCTGFQPPFDVPLLLKQTTQQAIPPKAQLFDTSQNVVTDTTIAGAPPVVTVSYTAVNGTTAVDETDLLDPLSQSSSGNSFGYDANTQTWHYNLSTSPYSAAGTYTVTLTTGDATKYAVSPTCSGVFVRQ